MYLSLSLRQSFNSSNSYPRYDFLIISSSIHLIEDSHIRYWKERALVPRCSFLHNAKTGLAVWRQSLAISLFSLILSNFLTPKFFLLLILLYSPIIHTHSLLNQYHSLTHSRTHSLALSLTYTHSRTHSLTPHSLTHSLTHTLTHSITHPLTYSLTESINQSIIYSLTYLLISPTASHSLTHSISHLVTQSLSHSLSQSRTHSIT